MKMKTLYIAIILTIVAGCAMPVTTVKTVDSRPSISITGAHQDAILYIDGISMGPAVQYNGQPNVLIIEPGTHKIEIKNNNAVIYQQTIFVESELKNIIIK
jgi:hypothetical protein